MSEEEDKIQPKTLTKPHLQLTKKTLKGLVSPITVKSSEFYLLIIEDAEGTSYYWSPDGSYDGNSGKCKED